MHPEKPLEEISSQHRGFQFLAPLDLQVNELVPRRVLVVGSCLIQGLFIDPKNPPPCECDFILSNNFNELPALPPNPVGEYDFQIVQLAMRSLMQDEALWWLEYDDKEVYAKLFEETCSRLTMQLDLAMRWNREHGLLTFVVNYPTPMQNPAGRLLPRYELSNPAYFIDQLNMNLETLVAKYQNAHILDLDKITCAHGKMYLQDDAVVVFAHNAFWPLPGADETRLEPLAAMSEHYDIRRETFPQMLWTEAVAMYRTARQVDAVKLVVVDLDDTLWKGVSGEIQDDGVSMAMSEGWPIGLVEALVYLKRRGILLAIISKNDESRVNATWKDIFGKKISLDDFAIRKINWQPKVDNMREVLQEVNLTARSVVFIDDNPVERAAMRAAFPDMRVLGKYPYYLRRILLWAPETQVVSVTTESRRRTEMIRAQIQRETQRKALSREEFLLTLGVKVKVLVIADAMHPRFARALELLNKTNQFNTTGRRWKQEECVAGFKRSMKFYAFEVEDQFTAYGLVAVIVVDGATIEQIVMSCRTVGLGVEETALAIAIEKIRQVDPTTDIAARFAETDANLLCRELYPRAGFVDQAGILMLAAGHQPTGPAHVEVIDEEQYAAGGEQKKPAPVAQPELAGRPVRVFRRERPKPSAVR
jgi:FkbH-like protein